MGFDWARSLYSLLTWAGQPLLRRKLRQRARHEPGYAEHVRERFGRYGRPFESLLPVEEKAIDTHFVWVHAVSLGETRAAALLLKELRQALPGMRLLLTHGTATGRAEGKKLLQPGDVQVWQPWDTPQAVNRFIRHFRPAVGILMETEVWPNLLAACQRAQVPVVLANARLNDRSYRAARRLAPLSLPAYRSLHAVLAQSPSDAQKFEALGVAVRAVLGNIKFDIQPDERQWQQGRAWHDLRAQPVVLLASSREGEEEVWVKEFIRNNGFHQSGAAGEAIENSSPEPKVQWLIVPRHPHRFDAVEQLLKSHGLRVSRRSQWHGRPADADVWLGDTLGEMPLYYGMADVALLGGSFEPFGGQNLIEAAACACPVILGPHTFNFQEAAQQACTAAAALRVPDLEHAYKAALQMLSQPAALEVARRKAVSFAKAHRGTAKATALHVRNILLEQNWQMDALPLDEGPSSQCSQ